MTARGVLHPNTIVFPTLKTTFTVFNCVTVTNSRYVPPVECPAFFLITFCRYSQSTNTKSTTEFGFVENMSIALRPRRYRGPTMSSSRSHLRRYMLPLKACMRCNFLPMLHFRKRSERE